MRSTSITSGPVRSPHGRVTVRVDRSGVTLVRHRSVVEALERLTVLPVGLGVAALLGSAATDGVAQAVLGLLGAALLALGVVLVLLAHAANLVQALRAVLTRRGRGDVRREWTRVRRLLRGDVDEDEVVARLDRGEVRAVPPLTGRLRPTLALATTSGELTLAGWPWRRADLELVRTAMGG